MNTEEFNEIMNNLVSLEDQKKECLNVARTLKQQLIESETAEPAQLGWAIFYEFKMLFLLAMHQEAFELIENRPIKKIAINSNNTSWIFSVMVEISSILNRPTDLIKYGRQCYEIRKTHGDKYTQCECLEVICKYLTRIQHDHLNEEFAIDMIEIAKERNDSTVFIEGLISLIYNYKATKNTEIKKIVLKKIENLSEFDVSDEYENLYELTELLKMEFDTEIELPIKESMLDLNDFCEIGESADDLFMENIYQKAIRRYSSIITAMEFSGTIDSYIMAKITLGTLMCLIQNGDFFKALEILNSEESDPFYGTGIKTIELGQTSPEDLMLYYLCCAVLQAHGGGEIPEQKEAIDYYMKICCQCYQEVKPEYLSLTLNNWFAIYKILSSDSVPKEWQTELLKRANENNISDYQGAKVIFHSPSVWIYNLDNLD